MGGWGWVGLHHCPQKPLVESTSLCNILDLILVEKSVFLCASLWSIVKAILTFLELQGMKGHLSGRGEAVVHKREGVGQGHWVVGRQN